MSRCFPYPPPYFGQAEIESIKLLKEENSKKHKEKAKRPKSHEKEKSLNSNHDGKQHKKRKHQEKSEDERSHKKQKSEKKQLPLKTSETIEQLEKSSLTEEHEHPCSIQHKLDSPESSQDSSKRRKMVSSSIHETQGSTLRIKLPSFRQRVKEPSPVPLSRQTETQPPPLPRQTELQPLFPPSGQVEFAMPSSRQIKQPQPALSTSGKVKLPSASSRQQPSLPQSRLGGELPVQRQIKVKTQLPLSDQVDPTVPLSRQTKLHPPLPPSRRVELALPELEPVERAMPLPRQTKLKPPMPPAGQVMPSLPSSSKQTKLLQQVPLLPLDVKTEKQRLDDKPAAVAEQPCSSSRPSEAATAATKTSRSKRVGGRRWQKEQYEILVANWNPNPPPAIDETSVLCEDDDDWLAVAPRQQRSPAKESSTSNATGSMRENHAVPSVQPRACYLPELNMYQLPYVVPF